ncbi:TniB family NTP-binding protein [Pleionea mediterranea]|uniref:TniB protein n=1 Tax=Pleionea mediterranea TaxID=523701 RepID=A0A316FWU0_9GAMM|nr:TniB family NTP-binding protein [Pleionea mediterranea]PWK52853.1 TniB protein [Pleionea mediterranea]
MTATINTKNERIREIQEATWIGYTQANQILDNLEDLLEHPKVHRMPNALIIGETNNGKSTIVNRFIKRHPAIFDEREDFVELPILSIEMPPEANQDSIYISILHELQSPYSYYSKKEQKASQVIGVMKNYGIKMLIIDEFNNLLDNTLLKQAQVLNTIKYLGNQLQIPIVAVGTKEAHRAILSSSQLANRFDPHVLPKWTLSTDYLRLLKSFEEALNLDSQSNLASKEMAIQILNMSEGWIGEISMLLKKAAIVAAKKGSNIVTLDILKKLQWKSPTERRRV